MKRKHRTQILTHCRASFLTKWAKRLEEEAEMTLVEEPANGLTMIQMRESAQYSIFYLGEVLISEARVECKGSMGIGIIMGNELQKAYDLAVIDAAYGAGLMGIQALEIDLVREEKRQNKEAAARLAQVNKTKVNFETMDVEEVAR